MIDRDDRTLARSRQVFDPLHFEAEQRAPQQAKEEREEVRGQTQEQVSRGQYIGEAKDDERHRLGQAEGLQKDHGRERARDHHEVVQRIDRGDHARAPLLTRPGLDRGEDRHDEQTARG